MHIECIIACYSHGGGHGGESDVANVTVVHGITGIRISQKVTLKRDHDVSERESGEEREREREREIINMLTW